MINLKLRMIWLIQDIRRFYYKKIHNINCDPFTGSMLPELKNNDWWKTEIKGKYLILTDKTKTYDEIRIFPSGNILEMEEVRNNICNTRTSISFKDLHELIHKNDESL